MKNFILIPVIILFCTFRLSALQSISLHGKVINEKNKAVNNLRIRFANFGEKITTDSGEFIIELPDNTKEVEIEVMDNKYELQYPVDGRIPVLSDESLIYKVVVKDNLDEIVESYKEIKKVLNEIGIRSEEMHKWLKNFTESESKKKDIARDEIKMAIQRLENREEPIKDISNALLNYNNAAQNIKTFFTNLIETALTDHRVLNELINALNDYNSAYHDIEVNKFVYENEIKMFWENQQLPVEFMSIVNYSTDELHKLYILKLGEAIAKINMLNDGTTRTGNEEEAIKSEIMNIVKYSTENLGPRLITLESKIDNFLSLLNDKNLR